MTSKTWLILAVSGLLSLGAGCKKDETTATDTPPPPPPPQSTDTTATAPGADGDVATCPTTMVPQSGTKRLLQGFTVFQALDVNSKVLTRLGPGTLINLKGSCSNWMLIEWPSGVGQLSLGWIELRQNDSRVTQANPADVKTAVPVVVDAGAPPVDAGAPPVDAGKRRVIIAPRLPK